MTAPTAPDLAPTPAADAAPSAPGIAEAIAEARARFAAGETIVPTEPAPLPHHAVTQPRAEDGTFAAEGEPDDGIVELVAEPDQDAPPAPGEGEGKAPEGAPVEEPPAVTVKLPGRREGDPDVEIEVTDPEVAERINQLRNSAHRTEVLRQEREKLDRDLAERQAFIETLQADPVAFVAQYMDPTVQTETALFLLTQPQVWDAVQGKLEEMLQDPAALQVTRAELKATRYETRDRLQQQRAIREQHRQEAQRVATAVQSLAPEGMPEHQAEVFHRDCLGDLAQYARAKGLDSLSPFQMLDAIAPRLEAYGIDPLQAAGILRNPPRQETPDRPAASPSRPPAPTPRPVAKAAVQGRDALKALARKVNAAAVPAPGQATPSAAANVSTKGQTIQDVVAQARARIAAGGGLTP